MLPKLKSLLVVYLFYSVHGSLEPCSTVGQLKADAEKCQTFYQCSHRGWVQLNCPDGLVFNDKISVCDWTKPGTKCGGNSDRTDISGHGSCETIGELKALDNNCNSFYQCTRYGWMQLTCGHHLTFNPQLSVCDWPKPGRRCGGNADTNQNSGIIDQDEDDDAMLEICEQVGQLKPDTEHCDRFYQCTLIGWAPVHCPEGFFYNSKLSVCGLSKPGNKCDTYDSDEDGDSKMESCNTIGELKSEQNSCQKFYQCTNDGWKPLTCPDSLFFNPKIQVCDWPESGSKCDKNNNSDDSDDQNNYEPCVTIGELKEKERNCDSFYQCTRLGWTELTCGHDLTFNPETSVCGWPNPGQKCGGNSNTNNHAGDTKDKDDDAMLEICEVVGQMKPDSENCERFYQCTLIGWAPVHCQDGFYFNHKLSVCDRSSDGSKCGNNGNDDDNSKLETCTTIGEFKTDDDNCQKFYQCTDNGWKALVCPDGLFFNSEIQVCDWPKAGFKCGTNNSDDDADDDDDGNHEPCSNLGELREEERNCDRFYQCTRHGWIQLSCGHGLTFNPENSVCDWPKPGLKCGGNTNRNDHAGNIDQDDDAMLEICEDLGQLKPDDDNCDRFYQCTRIGWAPVHCEDGFYFNDQLSMCDRSGDGAKCGRNEHDDDNSKLDSCDTVGEFKEDDDNCQKFYQCTNEGWKILTCPDGLFFNSAIRVCDWPKSGFKCEKGNRSEDDQNEDEDQHESCKILGELKEEERNCDRFYQCTRLGWIQLTCGHDLTFNPENSVCDWPKPGLKCGGNTRNDESTNSAMDKDEAMLEICEKLGQLKPDNDNCDRFYQCTRIGWAPVHCEDGFYFNDKLSMCDRSEGGNKCGRADHDDENEKLEPCRSVGDFKSDAGNCQSFYQCTNNGWKRLTCPDGLIFNADIRVCDWPKSGVKCGSNNDSDDHSSDNDEHETELDPCEKVGEVKADSDHCDLYYRCTSCGWSLVSCETGLLFDSHTLVCDFANNAKCAGNTENDQSDHRNSDDHSNDDDHDKDPLEPCDNVSELKIDPEDCNRYYECTTYGWQNMPCYNHLAFNPDKLICDYPVNVKC